MHKLLRMLSQSTRKGRPRNKFTSSCPDINHHQEKLVSFATSMIVEVSLRAGVQNIVTILCHGRQTRAFLLIRFRSLTCAVQSYCCLACPRSWTLKPLAVVVQAISALLSPTLPGFSALRKLSHGRRVPLAIDKFAESAEIVLSGVLLHVTVIATSSIWSRSSGLETTK